MKANTNQTLVQNIIKSWVNRHGPSRFGVDADSSVTQLLSSTLSADLVLLGKTVTGPGSLIYCKTSDWDSEMLGVRVGKFSILSSGHDSTDNKRNNLVSRFLGSTIGRFDLLIGRLDVRDVSDLGALEDTGFKVMDSLVTLVGEPVVRDRDSLIRLYVPSDRPFLENIGKQSFRMDHYHADPRLAPTRCDNLYSQWTHNSCEGRAAAVFVAEVDNEPLGFITCMLEPKDTNHRYCGIIDLVAVAPNKQGCGLGGKLVSTALSWFREQGVEYVEVGTQTSNVPAIRLYQRFGFQVFRFVYTVHGWPNVQASQKEDTYRA